MCGRGVTSSMALIKRPEAWIAVMATSRPEPGPLTLTSTSLTPYLVAAAAAVSAARCAANGVLLRLPLNPTVPDEAQHNASCSPAKELRARHPRRGQPSEVGPDRHELGEVPRRPHVGGRPSRARGALGDEDTAAAITTTTAAMSATTSVLVRAPAVHMSELWPALRCGCRGEMGWVIGSCPRDAQDISPIGNTARNESARRL